MELIAATILGKPVTPCEAALTCLVIPVVRRSEQVVYADSKPPKMRSRSINSRSRTLSLHLIDIYMGRPIDFENYTFKEYYKAFEVVKTKYVRKIAQGSDEFGNFLYINNRVVRFTEFSPLKEPEAFFYNILLQQVAFRDECDLFFHHQTQENHMLRNVKLGVIFRISIH